MTFLHSTSSSYNNNINLPSEKVNTELLTTLTTSSNITNNPTFFTRKELKAKLKYIVRKLLKQTQKNAWLAFEDMINCNNESSTIFTSHKYMAKRNRYSERTSKTIMTHLHEQRIILKERRGFKKSNRYFINWYLVYERPDLLEGYVSRVKCKSCTLSSSSIEEVIIINNDDNNFVEKEVLEEKKYDIGKYEISKNLSVKLEKEGIGRVAQQFWRDKFRIIAKDQKPWNGDKEWDIINANFAFSGFIHRERDNKKRLESLYICPIVRSRFKNKPKEDRCPQFIPIPKPEIIHAALERVDRSNNIEVDHMDKIMAEFRSKMMGN